MSGSYLAGLRALLLAAAVAIGGAALPGAAVAQETGTNATDASEVDRSATGGMQTLDDILKRQRGEEVPLDAGTGTGPDRAITDQLGAQGSTSDSELWRKVRQGESFTVSIPDPNAATLVQDEGEDWLAYRNGPLATYTGKGIIFTIVLLAIFYLMRGRIGVQGGMSGTLIQRFDFLERFGHWLLATTFIILAITGLALLFGRNFVIPALDYIAVQIHPNDADPQFGKETFAAFAGIGKWLHNNLSWAFIASLVLVFLMWVLRNIPTWTDVKWFAQGGGIFSDDGHPHSRKFNGGQKLIFWSVILLGGSIAASGVSLLFPYEFPMFAPTFAKLNELSAAVGRPLDLSTDLTPIQEMQYAQSWHVIVSAVLIVIIIAHIYIGSIGMKGAFSAMGSGKVDLNWARQHHDLWVEDLERKGELRTYAAPLPGGVPGTFAAAGAGYGAATQSRAVYEPPQPPASRVEPQAPTAPTASDPVAPTATVGESNAPPLTVDTSFETEASPWPRPHSTPWPRPDSRGHSDES